MSFFRYMKCLQTGMKREAVQEERSRGKGGGGGGGGDPGAGTNGTKEIRYVHTLGWAPWDLSCFEFIFDDTGLSS